MTKPNAAAALDRFTAVTRALADPGRVRALHALRDRELCVCQIVELLGLATSTVSRHMSVLRDAGLVESRKEGRWIYYRRPAEIANDHVRNVVAAVDGILTRDPRAREDERRLREILELLPEELCRRQGRC